MNSALATSSIALSRSALTENIRFLRDLVGPGVRFCSVVKGNAYGHGIAEHVPLAEAAGVRSFAVFGPEEAEAVLAARTEDGAVVVMGPAFDDALEWMIDRDVSFFVHDVSTLERAIAAAARRERTARIHLELETGLYRTGLTDHVLPRVARLLEDAGGAVNVVGTCTHFAGAEAAENHPRIESQLELFEHGLAHLNRLGVEPGLRHTACSAAALLFPAARMDLVRFGVAHYGLWPSRQTATTFLSRHPNVTRNALRPVLRWTSRVMGIKDVPAGAHVGYGTSYRTERSTRLAMVPVGYAQGFARSLSNGGRVLVAGREAEVVGVVNMSMLLADVSDISGAGHGDEVTLIGEDGDVEIRASSFSDPPGRPTYEMLVKLDARIPRRIVD